MLTDIEDSTRLWEHHATEMERVVTGNHALTREVVADHGGWVVKSTGDGALALFDDAVDAIAAAADLQRALSTRRWPAIGELRLRVGLNTGMCKVADGDVLGRPPNLASRLQAAGHGGQILLSGATADAARTRAQRRHVVARPRLLPHPWVRRAGRRLHGGGRRSPQRAAAVACRVGGLGHPAPGRHGPDRSARTPCASSSTSWSGGASSPCGGRPVSARPAWPCASRASRGCRSAMASTSSTWRRSTTASAWPPRSSMRSGSSRSWTRTRSTPCGAPCTPPTRWWCWTTASTPSMGSGPSSTRSSATAATVGSSRRPGNR